MLKPLSRHKSCVATSFISIQLILVSRPEDLYHDIKTPFHLEICRNINSPGCNQVSSSIKQPLSRPKLLLQHLFCLNKLFHVAEVSVATKDGNFMIYRRYFECRAFPTRFLKNESRLRKKKSPNLGDLSPIYQ